MIRDHYGNPCPPARFSQCEKILRALQQGPVTAAEIHRIAGSSRLNSRISELRKRGWVIECRHVGGNGPEAYLYELHESAESAEAPALPPRQHPLADEAVDSAEQLTLVDVWRQTLTPSVKGAA